MSRGGMVGGGSGNAWEMVCSASGSGGGDNGAGGGLEISLVIFCLNAVTFILSSAGPGVCQRPCFSFVHQAGRFAALDSSW